MTLKYLWNRHAQLRSRSWTVCVNIYFAAFLHIITGPNWQWSPTNTTCLLPITMGTIHSGSVDYENEEKEEEEEEEKKEEQEKEQEEEERKKRKRDKASA